MNIKEHITDRIFGIIGEAADREGVACYVVGGYVRDIFLHRESKDIDVVCVGDCMKVAEAVRQALGRKARLSVFKTYGTAQVKAGDLEVEFVGARKESYRRESRNPKVEPGTLQDDQLRRDFTINALAIGLNKAQWGELIDPFGGMRDMEDKLLRTPCDPDKTFSDDPLRMMRAIRFATQLGFYIEEGTFEAIVRNAERLRIVSGERIADELHKIMRSAHPERGWSLLDKCGLSGIILPELQALKGIETREGRGHKDNFVHTLTVLERLAAQSDNLWLRWAALLHDVGKARCKRWDKKTGWTFHNHDFVGQKMVKGIFTRMKFPLDEKMKYVQKMVGLHMRPIVLSEEEVTDSAVRRLLFDAGDDIDDLMTLCEADITSKNKEKQARYKTNFALVRQKLKEIEEKDRIRNFQPPVNGAEIMEAYGLGPCAIIGTLKQGIKDAILDGKIGNNRDEAWAYLREAAREMGLEEIKKA